MFAFIENAETSKCDSVVQTLSWMGKTPDNPPEGGSWRLNEANYYHHGWLASGNARGIVGVTFTSCQPVLADHPARTNFYLRGHRSEVVLVKWNEPYQKLATCDITGIIFVWIKHDGRWSIELINDRSSQVTDFSWSHDGQMALICYKDSFVLVGSVAGQRYWSSMLNLEGCTVTCGIWTPDDQKVMFGTTAGKVIVMSSSGTMIAQVVIHADLEITHLGWSAERFRLTEQTNNNKSTQTDNNRPATTTSNNNNNNNSSMDSEEQTSSVKPHILSVVLSVGDILLMTGYDDLCPRVIHTGLRGVKVEWSNDGNFLAVVGHKSTPQFPDVLYNELRFYNKLFKLQLSLKIPANQTRQPVTAMTWGHKDQRLFVAVGCELFTVWVFKSVASLQLLCKTSIHRYLIDDIHLHKLPLPAKLLSAVAEVFSPTIKGYIPHPKHLREYVCTSPPWKDRLHCTIMRHGDESSGGCYVLYLEHLGGLIPLLKGKRASKLHPDFVIYDPQVDLTNKREDEMSSSLHSNNLPVDSAVEDSDSDVNAREGSPGIRKKRKFLKLRESLKCRESVGSPNTNEASCEPTFEDILPEARHLVSITSNIWGTKFRFLGVPPHLPEELGSVTYKTSLLHLQPRQMTVGIVELPRDKSFHGNLLESECLDEDCNSNSYPDADDELYANYFYDIENLDQNSNCMVAISTENCSENLAATVASNFVEASSSSSFSPNSSLEESSNPKDSNSSKSNLSPSPLLDLPLSLQKSASPTHLGISFPQNVHLANLQSQLNEKIARVSPTEVDPFLEFFMKDRSCHGLGAQLESSGFVFINNVRDVMNNVGLRQELEEVKQIMLESVQQSCIRDEMTSRKIISSISDVTLVSSETITPEVNMALQDDIEDSSDIKSQRSELKQTSMPGVSLQFIDDDNDPLVDLYEQCQVKRDVSSEFDNLSARDVMIQSSVEVVGSPIKMVTNQNRDAKERLPVDSMTYSPSKNIIMKPLMCGKAAVSSSECSDFDSIQSMCSFEPCKTRLLITAGGGINSLTPEQTPSKLGRLSIGSVSKSRLREIARNALCRGNSSTGASCVGSGNAGGTGNTFCGHHNGRPKRRFFNGLCGISDPRGSSGNRHSVEDGPRSSDSSSPGSPVRIQQKAHRHRHGSLDVRACESLAGVASLSSSFHSTNLTAMPCTSRASNVHHLSASLPSSPIHKQLTSRQSSLANCPKQGHFLAAPSSTSHGNRLAGRSQLQSPLLLSRRRVNKCNQAVESSDEEHVPSSEDVTTSENYQNLETFQKARLHKKLKKVRSRNGENENLENASRADSPSASPQHQQTSSPRKFSPKYGSAPSSTSKNAQPKQKPLRHFVMHNKAPMWNDSSQVYQLDFGGRVTQESAKNFQIEFGGKQVMQFGRIDNNAYTLDFQYPYSATQAFAVALANVTQRLK